MSLPYFNMYPTDFEAKTSHLTIEEDGAYNRLLRLMWMTPGCSLPDDDKWIARRMRVDQDTFNRVVLPVIDEFCQRENGRVSNARLTEEYERSSASHKKRVSAGSKGGKSKSLKTKETCSSIAKAKPKQPEPEPEPDNTEANASDAAASQAVDFTKEVFDRGVAFLGKYGTPEKQARALIGKWRQQSGDSETFNALRDANREGVTEPVAWITARLKPSGTDMDEIWKQVEAKQNGLS